MTILFLAPRLPLPADTGGKIRTWNILKQIAGFAKVRLVCFSFEEHDQEFLPELQKLGIEATLVPGPNFNFIQKVVKVLLDSQPYSIAKYNTPAMHKAIAGLLAGEKFDLIHVDHLHMAHYVAGGNSVQSKGQKVKTSKVEITSITANRYSLTANGYPLSAILDEHNVEYKILERCATSETRWWKKILYNQQAAKTRKFERSAVGKLNVVTAVSEDDAAILRGLADTKTRIEVLPNGVDTDFFQPQADKNRTQVHKYTSTQNPSVDPCTRVPVSERSSASVDPCTRVPVYANRENDSIVFTGSLDWLPNDDAARYFISDILPLIWHVRPEVKFYVVGKSPSSQLQRLAASVNTLTRQHANSLTSSPSANSLTGQLVNSSTGQPTNRIIVTDRVPDVRPFMVESQVFVVPLRIGGGTRLKILEAMSFGIPVVSTSIGAEGIAYTDGKDIVIADEPRKFANEVLDLLKREERRATIATAGRELVLDKYDWGIIGKKLYNVYREMLAS